MTARRITVPPTAGLPLQLGDLRPWGDPHLDRALATWLGVDEVLLECSGTSALMLALRTLQQLAPERCEVVVPAYTCPLVAMAVAQCGLQLRLCDLSPDHLDLDGQALDAVLSHCTLAVVPTHLGGRVADVARLLPRAQACGAYVIEDVAQALGARVAGRSVGLQGDIALFSLAVGKGLSTYEGGVLLAREPALMAALRAQHQQSIRPSLVWELRRSLALLGYAAAYRPAMLDAVYGAALRRSLARGDWVEAAGDDFDSQIPQHRLGAWRQRVALRALARLRGHWEQAQQQAQRRVAQLRALPGVEVVDDAAPQAQGIWPVILLRLPSAAQRDALMQAHWASGWGLSLPFSQVLPDYARYAPLLGEALHDPVPQARDWAQRLLAISNSAWLSDAQFAQLLDALTRTLTRPPAAAG
nr:DegT/DnrJ/EryC1/StrS family aminotransferase [Comamonas koreensis]